MQITKSGAGRLVSFLWLATVVSLAGVMSFAAQRIPILITDFDVQDPEFIVDTVEILGWLGAIIGLLWLAGILTIATTCAGLRKMKRTWQVGETVLRRWSPRFLRHLIAGALGVGLSAGIALPSHATPQTSHVGNASEISISSQSEFDTRNDADSPSLSDNNESADFPSTGWDQQAHDFEEILKTSTKTESANKEGNTKDESSEESQAVLASTQPPQENHHVAEGESLWTIARDHLSAEASETQIDAAWRQWYEHNKDLIGSNPSLIHPGTELIPPPKASELS